MSCLLSARPFEILSHFQHQRSTWRSTVVTKLSGPAMRLPRWMALLICFATRTAGQVSDAESGISGPRRLPSPAPIPADRSGWHDIRLRDRELAQRLAAERRRAGFETGGLLQHRILEPVYGQNLPAIAEKAHKYFHEPVSSFRWIESSPTCTT